MIETIAIYFTPLASTRIVAYVGLSMAYHMGLVYTNSAGQSFGLTSGPSNVMTRQTPAHALSSLYYVMSNSPSSFGTLVSDRNNNKAFAKGHLEDYFTQNSEGQPYPHVTVLQGPDISQKWKLVAKAYHDISELRLTYSPTSQNSNSMATTALRSAGISVPFSSETVYVPGSFTCLPSTEEQLRAGRRGRCVAP
jgi:hypothetical protein